MVRKRRVVKRRSGGQHGYANFGTVGLDWQQRVNWDRLREYRIERARTMMKKHGLGAVLCMYDENVRYITGTLTPGWNRLKPGLRYAMLCGDGAADSVRAGRPRFPDRAAFAVDPEGKRAPLVRLDQRRGRPRLGAAGEQIRRRRACRR